MKYDQNLMDQLAADPASEVRKRDASRIKRLKDIQKGRVRTGTIILAGAWIASSYWTFNGLMMAAEETATAGFKGAGEALAASIVAAIVVSGCCSLLLTFSGSEDNQ